MPIESLINAIKHWAGNCFASKEKASALEARVAVLEARIAALEAGEA